MLAGLGRRWWMAAGFGLLVAGALPVLGQGEAPQTPVPQEAPAETAAPPTDGANVPASEAPAANAIPENAPTGGPETVEDAAKALETIEKSITLSEERAEELRAEIAALEGDRTKQNAALIAAAQRVKLAEIEITDVESRLDDLIIAELEVRGRLDGADAEIANVLAALARISRNPPPALIVDPSDALGSARGAILMSAILPQLQDKAAVVSADLAQLREIRAKVEEEEALLRANFAVLEEEQLRIATLIRARKDGVTTMSAELETEEREAVALAERATSLKELIANLTARVDAAQSGEPAPAMTPEAIRVALANTARTEPAIPFELAKGYLARPAAGVTVRDYGENDGFGGLAQGLSIVTRAEAQVVAPADGWVLYKGPYLNYGQIVILNTGRNYTALLAGLETVTVDIGQFVLMGEPLGTMGSRTIGRTVTTNAGNSQPTLYIELRRENEPIDPTGWWASEVETT
jgi:septal ring factor EnvC (AmiA/AmiB activator)